MAEKKDLPLNVLEDGRILVDTEHNLFEEAQTTVSQFAELKERVKYLHTYRINSVSLWNAASLHDLTGEEIIRKLEMYSKHPIPEDLASKIQTTADRWGKLVLRRPLDGETNFREKLILGSSDPQFFKEVINDKRIEPFITDVPVSGLALVDNVPLQRGFLKQTLTEAGYPVQDQIGVEEGQKLKFNLRKRTRKGKDFEVRDYQTQAVEQFLLQNGYGGGHGVVISPPGTGKTIIGAHAMAEIQECALILCVDTVAVRQWIEELVDKTTLERNQIGEYTGSKKEIKPVTVATYHVAIRSVKEYFQEQDRDSEVITHFELFNQFDWGLIIYDEVHRLPAEMFRLTAELQARRRLGLTATLIREDGNEEDIFSLVGPLRFRASWEEMEKKGWIAKADCKEVRINMPDDLMDVYVSTDPRLKFRMASENYLKRDVVKGILEETDKSDQVLIIGYFLRSLENIARDINAPVIKGTVPYSARQTLYQKFREGEEKILCVSNVANYAIDLPGANVAIQISGTYGSRQEEAQRLGRILRPKPGENTSKFYTLVSEENREKHFAGKRQRFLIQKGYTYSLQRGERYINE